MKKIIFFLISLFILGVFSFNFSDNNNTEEGNEKIKSEKQAALMLKIDHELKTNCKIIAKRALDYYSGNSYGYYSGNLSIRSMSRYKNIEISELCPNDYNDVINDFFNSFKEERIIINDSFITFKNGSVPLVDISFVSNIDIKNHFSIESLDVDRILYGLTVKITNDDIFTTYYINKDNAEIDRAKILNKEIDFYRKENDKL